MRIGSSYKFGLSLTWAVARVQKLAILEHVTSRKTGGLWAMDGRIDWAFATGRY